MMLKQAHRSSRRGFSLIELLAVITIIAIMAAVIGINLKPNEGASLRAAQASATSMFQAARTVASMRRTEARVIIFKKGSGEDAEGKFLRYMGVVYWDDENQTWVPANSGMYLPAGVYYIPNDYSSAGVQTGDEVSTLLASETAPTDSMKFPVTTGAADEWYYYSFDGSGTARSTGQSPGTTPEGFAGRAVVFASGQAMPPSGEPSITVNNEFSTAGFVIRRIGGVLPLNDYDQVESALQ